MSINGEQKDIPRADVERGSGGERLIWPLRSKIALGALMGLIAIGDSTSASADQSRLAQADINKPSMTDASSVPESQKIATSEDRFYEIFSWDPKFSELSPDAKDLFKRAYFILPQSPSIIDEDHVIFLMEPLKRLLIKPNTESLDRLIQKWVRKGYLSVDTPSIDWSLPIDISEVNKLLESDVPLNEGEEFIADLTKYVLGDLSLGEKKVQELADELKKGEEIELAVLGVTQALEEIRKQQEKLVETLIKVWFPADKDYSWMSYNELKDMLNVQLADNILREYWLPESEYKHMPDNEKIELAGEKLQIIIDINERAPQDLEILEALEENAPNAG